MNKEFHAGNRASLAKRLKDNSLLVIFSGDVKRKTGDENYPFFTHRDFHYLTGLDSKEFVLLMQKDDGSFKETVYILPPDKMAERWTGRRINPEETENLSGIEDVRFRSNFENDLHRLIMSGNYENIYLDYDKMTEDEPDDITYRFSKVIGEKYPFLNRLDAHEHIKVLRTIKQPCEIEAMKKAQVITKAGITAMMKTVRPGMFEYQLKAEWDYALSQFGTEGPAFPSIISSGENNFCIHYYDYKGLISDGEMILNDVGAMYDGLMCDVSRGYPVNGKFSDKQKLLYTCAYNTSEHMFNMVKPGMKMADVDRINREFNAEQLKEAGVLKDVKDIGTYMWHAGAHHVGYDVHDVVKTPEIIAPGMVFCVDIGIYHEEWGIGFRLEDNCLVTEDGCINLSRETPRTIEEIEDTMAKRIIR
ncbi:MAG: aminopeptidase P N-terminal domain-containing protein [Lachnospiraceae bacterium]|nr:aminopeptidase P N-terminal domain-containing protein [Lachnospiraceae bacterium]